MPSCKVAAYQLFAFAFVPTRSRKEGLNGKPSSSLCFAPRRPFPRLGKPLPRCKASTALKVSTVCHSARRRQRYFPVGRSSLGQVEWTCPGPVCRFLGERDRPNTLRKPVRSVPRGDADVTPATRAGPPLTPLQPRTRNAGRPTGERGNQPPDRSATLVSDPRSPLDDLQVKVQARRPWGRATSSNHGTRAPTCSSLVQTV